MGAMRGLFFVVSLATVACSAGSTGFADSGTPPGDGGVVWDAQLGDGGATCNRYLVETMGPGADGVLGTDDDVAKPQRTVQFVDKDNFIDREITYSGPGGDGKWDTPDDVIVSELRLVPGAPGEFEQIGVDQPGADGVWGTADDHVTSRRRGKRSAGHVDELVAYGSAGPDLKFGTADDVPATRSLFVYGDGVQQPKITQSDWSLPQSTLSMTTLRWNTGGQFSSAAGPDGTFGTHDDAIAGRYTETRNDGTYVQRLDNWSAGVDGTYFTSDDVVRDRGDVVCTKGVYDARLFSSPGPDGVWRTADDVVSGRFVSNGCGVCGAQPSSPFDPR